MRNIPVTAFRVFCYSPWWLLSSTRMLSCVVLFLGSHFGAYSCFRHWGTVVRTPEVLTRSKLSFPAGEEGLRLITNDA